jgi:hypothetical protein
MRVIVLDFRRVKVTRALTFPSPRSAAVLTQETQMKKMRVFLFAMLAIALFSSSATAAVPVPSGDNTVYFVTYYSNNVSGAPDATLRFINDGSGYNLPDPPPPSSPISLAADIYVFDDSQELVACGACWISADGLLSEDVKTELTNNPLTGRVPSRGVIKVIADVTGDPFNPTVSYGLHGWATHIERATPTSGAYATTETAVADSILSLDEDILLGNLCYYAGQLGSGQGTITCTLEDHDF